MKQWIRTYELAPLALFLQLYALILSTFSFFRAVLFFVEYNRSTPSPLSDILHAFIMGVRFDIVICGYILLLPFILLSVFSLLRLRYAFLKHIIQWYILILVALAFLISAADIPFYGQFLSRFSVVAFEWMDTPMFVIGMIAQEPRYFLYVLLFSASLYLAVFILRSLFRNELYFILPLRPWHRGIVTLLAILLMIVGIRGRLEEKSPIRIGTAYFCNNPFLNQLGLNPSYTLIHSLLELKKQKHISWMDNQLALTNVKHYLGVTDSIAMHPLARSVATNAAMGAPPNVIIVIMESMSAGKMKRHGNTENLTPFLDSLSNCGYYFENCYTAGIHTYNGIFSTLCAYPAISQQHPMKETSMIAYPSIAATLKQHGYSSIYFTTHDGQFDNAAGFLKHNQFDRIIEKSDYPDDQIRTTLGVPDDYLFRFSIPVLNELHKRKKPFLSVFMTASDHGPYYIPGYFKPRSNDEKKGIVEYADFSIRQFITIARQQEWFANTIFVFVADHGAPLNSTYPISLDYVHTPLLFYAPARINKSHTYHGMASQMDVFPTIMGMTGLPYINSTMGIDLLSLKRPYSFFSTDDAYGVIDSTDLLIVHADKKISIFNYRTNDPSDDYASAKKEKIQIMRNYAESHMQAYLYLKKNTLQWK